MLDAAVGNSTPDVMNHNLETVYTKRHALAPTMRIR
jgi:lipoate synthase